MGDVDNFCLARAYVWGGKEYFGRDMWLFGLVKGKAFAGGHAYLMYLPCTLHR